MKLIKFFLITTLFISVATSCAKSKKHDESGLLALVLNNSGMGTVNDGYTNGSLVILNKIDLVNQSYTGQCFDTFTAYGAPISPSNYYATVPGGAKGTMNTNIKKYALSTSNCNSLGFSSPNAGNLGSASQRPDTNQDFRFKMYSCDPNNNPCATTAIKAAGF